MPPEDYMGNADYQAPEDYGSHLRRLAATALAPTRDWVVSVVTENKGDDPEDADMTCEVYGPMSEQAADEFAVFMAHAPGSRCWITQLDDPVEALFAVARNDQSGPLLAILDLIDRGLEASIGKLEDALASRKAPEES